MSKLPKEQKEEILKQANKSLVKLGAIFFPHYFSRKPAKLHFELSDLLINSLIDKYNLIICMPRGTAKSTYMLLFFPIYILLFTEIEYILLIGENEEKITEHLKYKLKQETEDNKLLNQFGIIFKQYREKENELTLLAPSLKKDYRNVIIKATSFGSSLRGLAKGNKRPEIILIDDLERSKAKNLSGVESPEYRQEVKKWFYSEVMFLGEHVQDTRIIMAGTIMHPDQLLNELIENPPSFPPFKSIKYSYIEKDKNGKEYSIWEDKYSLENLYKMKKDYEERGMLDVFYNEMLSIPISPETQIIKPQWIKYIDKNKIIIQNGYVFLKDDYGNLTEKLSIFITIDPAISITEKADYTAMAIVGIDSKSNWYILDIYYDRIDPSTLIIELFKKVQQYNPLIVGIEKVGYQKALKTFIEQKMIETGLFFNLELINPEGMKKEERIKLALQWRYKQGKIYHLKEADYLKEYENELLSLTLTGTKTKHDDLIDAVSMIDKIAFQGEKVEQDNKFNKTQIIDNYETPASNYFL